MDPANVAPGVYVGPAEAVPRAKDLGITHLLRVHNVAPGPDEEAGFDPGHTLWVDLEDVPSANLLAHLPATNKFIRDARAAGGSVLVACAQGVSRSPAVVAAYLMEAEDVDVDCAWEMVVDRHPAARANEGFGDQLRLFREMGYRLDPDNAEFREFRAFQASIAYEESGVVDPASLAEVDGGAPGAGPAPATAYSCRKCRAALASSGNTLDVGAGPGPTAFWWRKRNKELRQRGGQALGAEAADESSVFVEPLAWMAGELGRGQTQGKLYCPGCAARIGSYNWAGIQNSSGRWIVPAFQLHAARMDARGGAQTPDAAPAAPATRGVPRFLPSRTGATQSGGPPTAGPPRDPEQRLPPGGFTHLILDCDGVMVDTERPSCESLYRAVLKVSGVEVPHSFPEDFYPVFGMDLRSCAEYYWQTYPEVEKGAGPIQESFAAFSAAKEASFHELTDAGIQAFAGIRELVLAAQAAGLGVAIASSGSPDKISRNLTGSGLIGLVPAALVVSAAYVARGKPAPDVYLEALKRLGCSDPSRAMVIEDAVNGCVASRGAGCFTVAVTNTLPRSMLESAADRVVESAAEATSILLGQ